MDIPINIDGMTCATRSVRSAGLSRRIYRKTFAAVRGGANMAVLVSLGTSVALRERWKPRPVCAT